MATPPVSSNNVRFAKNVMGEEPTIKRDQAKGERRRLPCGSCNAATYHTVEASIDIEGEVPGLLRYWESYQVIQCLGCTRYSFREVKRNSDEWNVDTHTGEEELAEHEVLYPPRVAGRAPIRRLVGVPSEVRTIYHETHKALLGGQPILAGVGLRSLVEAVCRQKNATGGNLQKRIDSLVDLGVLTRDGAEILHALRNLGNAAAHEAEAYAETDLSTALDVVEHLLQSVYIIPRKAARLQKGK